MEWSTILLAITSIITLASAVVAATPTPDPSTRWGKIYRVIEFLGLVVGKAKDQGLIPPQSVRMHWTAIGESGRFDVSTLTDHDDNKK